MRTRTCPGPGVGTGTSRTSRTSAGSPKRSKTTAFIRRAPVLDGGFVAIVRRSFKDAERHLQLEDRESGPDTARMAAARRADVPLHGQGSPETGAIPEKTLIFCEITG